MNMTQSDFAALWQRRPKGNGVLVRWYAFSMNAAKGVRPGNVFNYPFVWPL